MTLLIDRRVGSRDLYPILTTCCSFPVSLTDLQSGDAAWSGMGPDGIPVTIGVERKAIHDLISSKDSGRLSGSQLVAMGNHFSYGYVVIEGLWKPGDDGALEVWRKGGFKELSHGNRRYTTKEVNKFLNTLAVRCGVMLWRTASPQETARWLADMYGWWQEPWDSHKSHKAKMLRASTLVLSGAKQSRLSRMLQEVDGVGMDRAEAIAAQYGSMGELVSRGAVEDVAGIPYGKRKDGVVLRVGKGTAEKIMRQLWEG